MLDRQSVVLLIDYVQILQYLGIPLVKNHIDDQTIEANSVSVSAWLEST